MRIIGHYLCTLVAFALIAIVPSSANCQITTLEALDTLDAWVQKQNPGWLPEYQNISVIIHQGQTRYAQLLLEAFLRMNAGDETEYRVAIARYLLMAGEHTNDFIQELACQYEEPWVAGTHRFLQTLSENRRLQVQQGDSLLLTLRFIWQRQSLQQILFAQALEGLQELQDQQPYSLTLAWLTGVLLRMSPDGGHWRVEQYWQEWIDNRPEADPELVQIYRQLRFQDKVKEKSYGSWPFPGADAAIAFDANDMAQKANGRNAEYFYKEHWEDIKQAWRSLGAALTCIGQPDRKLYDLKLCVMALDNAYQSTAHLCSQVGGRSSRDKKARTANGECIDLQEQLGVFIESYLTEKQQAGLDYSCSARHGCTSGNSSSMLYTEPLSAAELTGLIQTGERLNEILGDVLFTIGIVPIPHTRVVTTAIHGLSRSALLALSAGLKARARQVVVKGEWIGQNIASEEIIRTGTKKGFKGVITDLRGGLDGAKKMYKVLTGKVPKENILTDIPNTKVQVYLRYKTKTGTPAIEITNWEKKTIEKIHFNP